MPFRETACEFTAIDSSPAGRSLTPVGSDDESSRDSRHTPNHAPTVASSVLRHDIAGRQQHLHAMSSSSTTLPERTTPKSVESVLCMPGSSPSSTCIPGRGSGATTSDSGEYRRYDEADATYGCEWSGRRRIVPRIRVGRGPIGTPKEGELSQARDEHPIDLLVARNNSPTLGVVAGDYLAYLHSLLVRLVHGHVCELSLA